jgi:hypothetical protein
MFCAHWRDHTHEKEVEILLSNQTQMRIAIADLCLDDIRFALELDSQRKEAKAK